MNKRISPSDPASKPLYTLKNSALRLLQFISGQGAVFPYHVSTLVERTSLNRAAVKKALEELEPMIDQHEILLREEHRKDICMCLMHVKMNENTNEFLAEIEDFFRTIPNISEIYRIRSTERDYIIKVNYMYPDDLEQIRDLITNHRTVKHILGTNTVIRPVNTPHSEVSFLFASSTD